MYISLKIANSKSADLEIGLDNGNGNDSTNILIKVLIENTSVPSIVKSKPKQQKTLHKREFSNPIPPIPTTTSTTTTTTTRTTSDTQQSVNKTTEKSKKEKILRLEHRLIKFCGLDDGNENKDTLKRIEEKGSLLT